MAEFEYETFTDQRVVLDGNTYTNCNFVNSQIVFQATAPVTLQGVTFQNCSWTFDGAAGLTINFMTALYRGGMATLMEQTFANIRGQPQSVPAAPSAAAASPPREAQQGAEPRPSREDRQERRRQRQAAAPDADGGPAPQR